jgi:hypothetical protein
VRNLCLFKRSVAEKIGYADANFWPGGYFEDNDYCKRARMAGVKACGLAHSAYFHFWSRTIHQEGGSTTGTTFDRNGEFYGVKWGGPFDHERYAEPFDGKPYLLDGWIAQRPSLRISDRKNEGAIVEYWSRL